MVLLLCCCCLLSLLSKRRRYSPKLIYLKTKSGHPFKPSQVILKPSHVILKPNNHIILKPSRVILKPSHIILKLSQIILKPGQVILKPSQENQVRETVTFSDFNNKIVFLLCSSTSFSNFFWISVGKIQFVQHDDRGSQIISQLLLLQLLLLVAS